MLPKSLRLPAKTMVQFTNTTHSPHLILKVGHNTLPYSRFAFVVSKRIDKRATVRNKIKRMIRIFIEKNTAEVKNGLDMVLVAKKSILSQTSQEIQSLVRATLSQGGYLK